MTSNYNSLISHSNLFQAWEGFKRGKRKKRDVMMFERNLEDNLFNLHQQLKRKTYKHGRYTQFYVNDPKRRHIHKADVTDRIVHHLLYKYLYEVFDKTFIYDSYSCRIDKGTHKAVKRLKHFSQKLSKNYTRNFWALKLDIRQFFASVDHGILLDLISGKVKDKDVLWLVEEVIRSFASAQDDIESLVVRALKGIPLGNLTSQIFANIYMNELDQFVKNEFKIKYYIRYADDFLILDKNKQFLGRFFERLEQFLRENLKLEIHPNKIIFRKFSWGIDFCGYIVLPYYILPRTKTRKRVLRKVSSRPTTNETLQSYLGYLSHSNSHNISCDLKNYFYLNRLLDK